MQNQFEKFYENIKLTPHQLEDAEKKYNGVCKKLHDYYYPEIEYTGDTKLLIGSYGKHTNIRPPRDIDVLFIMPDDIFKQYSDNLSNSQSQLLQDIRNILSEKYPTTEEIKAWGKVVLIKFADGTHNVELLQAWEQNDDRFIIPNTEKGGSWEFYNPRYEIERINRSDKKTGGKTRALIRMIKKWSENCSVRLKSFQIETKVLDFFNIYNQQQDTTYSVLVRDFFHFYLNNSDSDYKSYLETAFRRADKACNFEIGGKLDEATAEWKKIFGDDFPAVENEKSLTETKPILADYSHCEPLRWPYEKKNKVSIDAYVYTENKQKRRGGINSDGRNLAKGLCLKFIANTNATGVFEYYWQVVNTGEAAKKANDLRGKIFKGNQVQWEHTKYTGKHWIECFIVQSNICVARSGKFFVNIK